jgi:hypothetical protein
MTHTPRKQLILEGRVNLPMSEVNKYRVKEGLEPLDSMPSVESVDRVIHPVMTKRQKKMSTAVRASCSCTVKAPESGPGTELKATLKAMGVPPCQQCVEAAKRMNALGVAGCREHLDELAAEMLPRAMEWIAKQHPWIHALMPNVVQEIEATRRITNLITEAINAAEEKEKAKTAATIRAVRSGKTYAATKFIPVENSPPIFRIRTALRVAKRKTPTVYDTIASMVAAGFESPAVYAEPDAPSVDGEIRWAEKKGAFRSFVDMCEDILNGQSCWLLLCEDDVKFKDGCADFLRTLNITQDTIVSLYTSAKQDDLLAGDGLTEISGDMHGSLAYLIHADILRKIIDSRTLKNWQYDQRVDRAVCQAASEIEAKLLCHRPALAQHTGEASALVPTRGLDASRMAENFTPDRISDDIVTLITPTGDRPEAFAMCEHWMRSQRYTGAIQWIVVDDGKIPTKPTMADDYIRLRPMYKHSLCRNLAAAIPKIRGRFVLIIEDDDYYGPDYVSTMVGRLHHADLVGEFGAKYYFVNASKYRHRTDARHSSLCRTGMTNSVIQTLTDCVTGTDHPSVDLRLWERWTGSALTWVDVAGDTRMCVGIKGVAGRQSKGWRVSPDALDDSDGSILRLWCGEDSEAYERAKT